MITDDTAGGEASRRLYVYNGGFLTQKRPRRILSLAGWDIRLGQPGEGDWVGVWGKSPTAHRGEGVAARKNAPILRVEDALLRSVLPGRSGSPALGLLLDKTGVHFDSAHPSDIETLLATHPLDDTHLLNRARAASDWIRRAHLSKYNAFLPGNPVPNAPYVLVIDQTRGDASIAGSGANADRFAEMLYYAQDENPGQKIVIKTHPETQDGHREGHFDQSCETDLVTLLGTPVSPWDLFEGATAVYTVSSGLGFEAIFAGHKPRVFGQPFYTGWGLTDDRFPPSRRGRPLTRAQLFAGAMILYPTWYDPYRDQLCELEDAIATLAAQSRAWREDHEGYIAKGMRLWKRAPLQKFYGQYKRLKFDEGDKGTAKPTLVWAGKTTPKIEENHPRLSRVEDGFLRSRGLGASLIPPLSLVADDLGIYYDPNRESRLEHLIAKAANLSPDALQRADDLIHRLKKLGLSKYNLGAENTIHLPAGHRILVPGQVEDDASIQLGCSTVCTNRALLNTARQANPNAVIVYKPHPDVEAGLRAGALDAEALQDADVVLPNTDPIALIDHVDEVWTMTSLMGFEALLRGKAVTCLGTPFYAGWGLTTDLGAIPDRRTAKPSLTALVHAVLIDYPRYHDPVTNTPCPVEVVVDRLASGEIPNPGALNRTIAKLQGVFASYAWIWR